MRIADGLDDALVGRSPKAYMDPAKFKSFCHSFADYVRRPGSPSEEGRNVLWLDGHCSHLQDPDALDGREHLLDNNVHPSFIPSKYSLAVLDCGSAT